MSRTRKLSFLLMLLLTAGALSLGVPALFTPANAKKGTPPCDSAACDPSCRHWCPYGKKIDHRECIFAGCIPTTGECTYSCSSS